MEMDYQGYIDPLADTSFLKIADIPYYTELKITEANRGDAKLIAYDFYGSIAYERVVLYYNGLYTDAEIVPGMTIRLPNKVSVDTTTQVKNVSKRTVRI